MKLSEKQQIYKNVWQCAHKRRHFAKQAKNWDLYERENQTVLMCLNISRWWEFDTEKPHYLN